MKLYIVLFSFVFCAQLKSVAQILPNLGWFNEAQLFYNPSYAGLGDELRGTLLSRGQWKGIVGAPSTYYLAADSPLGKRVGLGAAISRDAIGHTVENKFAVNASYRVYMNSKSFFQAGLKAEIAHFSSKYSQLSQWDEDDPLKVDVNTTVPRIGFGITYKTPSYYVAFSAPDFFSFDTKGQLSDNKDNRYMRRNYFLIGETELTISEYVKLIPSVMIRYYEKRAFNFTFNAGIELNQTVQVGLSYVHPNIYGIYGKVALTPRIKFGYRHELSPTVISVGTFGTSELLLTYGFN